MSFLRRFFMKFLLDTEVKDFTEVFGSSLPFLDLLDLTLETGTPQAITLDLFD